MSWREIVIENFVYSGLKSVPGNVDNVSIPDVVSAIGSGAKSLPIYEATGGETTIQNDYLIGATLTWVVKNGNPLDIVAEIDPLNTSGIQVTLNNVTGVITFQTALSQYDTIGIIYSV